MVQRVELVPASVRGYGNVVSPKVVGDFEVFNCSLSQVDSVYTMVYGAGEVSVALSVSPATIVFGQSVVLEATVLEDNNPLEGVTVQFFDGNSVLGTGTSDVNGVASLTVSDLGVGSHSINAQYDSESSNIVSVTVNVPYTDIVLTSDKDTLSFADGDSTNVYCQLVDGQGSAVAYAGESVTFEVRKVSDDSLVETLTPGTTNSSGIATTTMNSRGTGDVYIKSSCGLVSKIFALQDCSYYNTAEVTRSSTNGSTIYDNSLSQALPSKCEISFDLYSNNSTDGGEHRFFLLPKSQYSSSTTQPTNAIYVDALKTKMYIGKRESSTVALYTNLAYGSGSYRNFKIIKDGTDLTFYIDDNLIGTSTISWIGNHSDYCLSMMRWSTSGTSKIKNVKFKPL